MNLIDVVRTAMKALGANVIRAFLTALGVAVGAAATTVVVVLGHGARDLLDGKLESVGKNLIVLRSGTTTADGFAARTPLTPEDAKRLREDAFLQRGTTGIAEGQATLGVVSAGSLQATTTIDGVHPHAFRVRRWTLEAGRFLTRQDDFSQAPVCVLGHTVREQLFPRTPATALLGRSVTYQGLRFKIVGVLKPRGKDPLGRDHDDELFIPLSVSQARVTGLEHLSVIIAVARQPEDLPRVTARMRTLLREQHRLRAGEPDDVDISTVEEMAALGVSTMTTMNVLTMVLAAIALGVGGIGVAATMLATVGERTREIGLRCGLGALPRDIRLSVFAESLFLTGAGGAVGLTVGVLVARAATLSLGWPFSICPVYLSAAASAILAVGVAAGAYPALKASRLDPIVALRMD